MYKKRENKKMIGGFTMVELMLTVSIVSVITSIIMFNYKGFNTDLILASAAQELATDIRNAQALRLSPDGVGVGGDDSLTFRYGVSIPRYSSVYYLFVDRNDNRKFDDSGECGGSNNECIEKFSFSDGTGTLLLGKNINYPTASFKSIEIMFVRPESNAVIFFVKNNGTVQDAGWNSYTNVYKGYEYGYVQLAVSGSDKITKVIVFQSGQITIQ